MMRRYLFGAAAGLMVAAQSQAGVTFTTVTTADGGGGRGGSMTMTAKAWVDKDGAKIEFEQGNNPVMAAGSYVVTKDAGKTMSMVNPKDQTYTKWDMEQMMGMAGGAMQKMRGMMSMNFSEPKVEKLLDEDGGKMFGMPTRHYKFRTSYNMEMTVMGSKHVSQITREEDIWATTKLLDAGFGAWMKKQPPKVGDEQLDALIKAQMEKVQGFPIKRLAVTSTKDAQGNTRVSKMSTEVTELKESRVPAGTFDVPANYKEASMPAEGEGGAGAGGMPNKALMNMLKQKMQQAPQ